MVSTYLPSEQRVKLSGISWDTYQSIKAEPENRNLRLTYYRGVLEIMAPSPEHEYYKKVIGRFVETLAEEFVISLYPLGSITLEREDLVSGAEPDECFYLTLSKIRAVKGKKRIDLNQDPAPDLVVEVDITSRSRYREQVYAALQIPEVWRYDGQTLTLLSLSDERYVAIAQSIVFPKIEAKAIELFLRQAMEKDYLALVGEFRQWLRSLSLQ
ncbi:Uma2 family endonuclease [Leptolyngbya sp. BC1307]|uniref:Uma2 family endonuclease n=1 Tax=Leptolyngbya sp. BC1307 TaxID=2029589 RepID=UPI000EFA6960|nr:Uma2 family endonuclease [Leptolyngbya sp. BC1307]